jgi:hypothetical protein
MNTRLQLYRSTIQIHNVNDDRIVWEDGVDYLIFYFIMYVVHKRKYCDREKKIDLEIWADLHVFGSLIMKMLFF